MTNPTDPRSLPQRRPCGITQVTVATALVTLLQENAPAATWHLPTAGTRLEGQLTMPGSTSTDKHKALAEWQRIIGAGPVTSVPVGDCRTHLTISGSYEGVPVHVATIVTDDTPGAVAA